MAMDEVMIFEGAEEEGDEECPHEFCDESLEELGITPEGLKGRHCIEVQEGADGVCRCSRYAVGTRPPHVDTFKDLCADEKLDIPEIGTHKEDFEMAKAKRKTPKRRRRRSTSGLGGPIKDFVNTSLIKQTLIAGVIAAGGAYLFWNINNKLSSSLKLKGQMRNIMLLALAGIGAGMIYKFTRKKDIALAAGLGPVMVVALQLVGKGTIFATQPQLTGGMGLVTAEPAPSFEPLSVPPTMTVPTVSNLFAESAAVV